MCSRSTTLDRTLQPSPELKCNVALPTLSAVEHHDEVLDRADVVVPQRFKVQVQAVASVFQQQHALLVPEQVGALAAAREVLVEVPAPRRTLTFATMAVEARRSALLSVLGSLLGLVLASHSLIDRVPVT